MGGADHPRVDSLRVNLAGAVPGVVCGYGGEPFVDRWVRYGRNLLEGKPYTVSVPPDDETSGGWNFQHVLGQAVPARFVRFRITPKRILGVSEVQAFDFITFEPFTRRIALPDDSP